MDSAAALALQNPCGGNPVGPAPGRFRGTPPYDKKAIERLLLTVSEVIEAYPEIQELDLNPVIVHENGLKIADARVILKED